MMAPRRAAAAVAMAFLACATAPVVPPTAASAS